MTEQMTLEILCGLLELPDEVSHAVLTYQTSHISVIDKELREQLKNRIIWDAAIKQIHERIGADESGFCILSELLSCACGTYEEYQKMGIADTVFIETIKFCTRFIIEHKRIYGNYAYTWAWWFPRQLALQEFRIEELEFEFVDEKEKWISIHIPSDANMKPEKIQKTFAEYRSFLQTYYPEWIDADWYCESWMLSPVLKQLLPENSNIIMFQKQFDILSVDYESMAVLDWVFPGEKADFSKLSEQTSLQKNMKKFLLNGGKTGWAKGKFVGRT